MAYSKYHDVWKDYPDTSTPINKAFLEHLEAGLAEAAANADAAAQSGGGIPRQPTAPNPSELVWFDTSTSPATLRGWNGTAWVVLSSSGGDLTTTDNGDGTATLAGTAVTDNGDGTFAANSTSVTDNGDGTYTTAA